MAETYRGLTVRFGGDTTDLQHALERITTTLSTTQYELNRVNKALRFDPEQVLGLSIQMNLLNGRAEACYEKMSMLRRELQTIDSSKSIDELSIDTAAAASAAARAKAEYDEMNREISRLRDNMPKIAGDDLVLFEGKGNGRKDIEEALQLFASMNSENAQMVSHLKELQKTWHVVANDFEQSKNNLKLADLVTEYSLVAAEAKSIQAKVADIANTKMPTSDVRQYREAMSRLDETVSMLDAEMKGLDEAFGFDPSSIDLAKDKFRLAAEQAKILRTQVTSMAERLKEIGTDEVKKLANSAYSCAKNFTEAKKSLESVTEELGLANGKLSNMIDEQKKMVNLGKTETNEYRELEDAISACVDEVARLSSRQEEAQKAFKVAEQAKEYRQLNVQMQTTAARAKDIDNSIENAGKSSLITASNLKSLGMAVSMNVTPVLSQFLNAAVTAAQEIDAAYRDMRKTVNGTEDDFEAMRQAAIDFSTTHVTSADQILEIQAMGGQLGIATDALMEFSSVVADLDVATNIDADTMAQELGQLANILDDLTNDKFRAFADALTRLGNNNAALESDIMDITSRIGSIGSIMGFSTPQLLAWSTAIAATGQNSEAAGTAISNTMSDIENAVATGGDALDAFAQIAGMTAEQFAKAWKKDPSDALLSFVKGLRSVKDEGGSVDATLEGLGITAVRQKQAIQGLTQTVETLDDALAMSQNAWDGVSDQWGEAGDAAAEAEKKAQGFSGQLSILQNNAQVLGAEIAETLAPVLANLNILIQGLVEVISETPEGIRLFVVGIAAMTAAIGPVVSLVAPFVDAMNNLDKKSKQAAKSQKEAAKQIKAAGTASKAAKTAVAGLAAAFAAIVVVTLISEISDLVEKYKEAKKGTEDLTRATEKLYDNSYVNNARQIAQSNESLSESMEDAAESAKKLSDGLESTYQAHISLAESIDDTWSDVNATAALVDNYAQTISELANRTDEYGNSITLTNEQQQQLKVAVDGYNSATGESVQITDLLTGTISTSTEAILKNAEAWKENARVQALQEAYSSVYKQYITDQQNLAEATDAYSKALAAWTKAQNDYNTGVTKGRDEVVKAKSAYDSAKDALEKYSLALDDSKKALDNVSSAFDTFALGGTSAVDVFESAANRISGITDKTAQGFATWATNMGVVGNTAMVNLANAIINGKDPVLAVVENLSGLTSEQFMKMAEAAGVSSQKAMDSFVANVKAGTDPAVAAVMAVTGTSADEFKALAAEAGYSGEDALERFAAAVITNRSLSDEAMRGVGDSAYDNLKERIEGKSWASLGSFIDSGLAGGLGTKFVNAVGNLASAAWSKFKEVAGINSPAKLFIPGGRYVDLGLAKGVEDNQYVLEDAMKDTALNMRDTFNAQVDRNISGYRSGYTRNASYQQAVLDGTNSGKTISIGNLTVEVQELQDISTIDDFVSMIEKANVMAGR